MDGGSQRQVFSGGHAPLSKQIDGCIVTGVDESHAREVFFMLHSARQIIPTWELFVYDLGLFYNSTLELKELARLREPPDGMPEWTLRFERGTTSFKPWIIRDLMTTESCTLIMYADASIRFRPTFRNLVESSTLLDLNLLHIDLPQKKWTHPAMYQWFSRDRASCSLKQYQGTSILFRPHSTLWKNVFSLWKKCCQHKLCVLPDGALIKNRSERHKTAQFGYKAHRDDQSALNFALATVVGEEVFYNFNTLSGHLRVVRSPKP